MISRSYTFWEWLYIGMNPENTEVKEGIIRFDIIFYVRMRDGIPVDDRIR